MKGCMCEGDRRKALGWAQNTIVSLIVFDIECRTNVTVCTYVQHESTITAMPTKRLDPSADAQCCERGVLDDFDVVLLRWFCYRVEQGLWRDDAFLHVLSFSAL